MSKLAMMTATRLRAFERVARAAASDRLPHVSSSGETSGVPAPACADPRPNLRGYLPAGLSSKFSGDAEREIVESCRVIKNLTGQSSVPFAFPYFGGGIDRAWLARLRKQHDVIGLFFDTQGLGRDVPYVVQRVFGERIEEIGSIDRILRRAWRRRISLPIG